MELTATNRSQAYPKAENGSGQTEVDGNTEWFQTGTAGRISLRSKGTDENTEYFWRYPFRLKHSKQRLGLERTESDEGNAVCGFEGM